MLYQKFSKNSENIQSLANLFLNGIWLRYMNRHLYDLCLNWNEMISKFEVREYFV